MPSIRIEKFAAAALLTFGAMCTAHAQLFVTQNQSLTGSVGQYALSGDLINANLIKSEPDDVYQHLAVSSNSIYVATWDNVAQYTLDGTLVNAHLITGVAPMGIAVSDDAIYVASNQGGLTQTLGKYALSGAAINTNMLSGFVPGGVAVSNDHVFVSNIADGTLGMYTTSGEVINANLISGLNTPFSIVVSGNDIYVRNYGNGTVGKYLLSGTTATTVNASLISGLDQEGGMAIAGDDLFLSSRNFGIVSEYTTSGELVNASLISGLAIPSDVAVLTVPEPHSLVLSLYGLSALAGLARFKRRGGACA